MCIIAVCEDRVLTDKEVELAASGNPDGIGIAWSRKDCIVYRKGLSVEDLNKLLDSGLPMPLVVHFRLASSGSVSDELCHPFLCSPAPLKVGGCTRSKLLFHNGVYSEWETLMVALLPEILRRYKKVPEGEWNDSRIIALAVGMFGEQVLKFIGGKYAIMKPDGAVDMYGKFDNSTGVWLSAPLVGHISMPRWNRGAGLAYGGIYSDDDYDFGGIGGKHDSLEEAASRGGQVIG